MTPSGNLDLMFGSAGVVTVDFNGANDRANAVAIESDGKVVLGGFATAAGSSFDQFALVRLNVDGTLDSSFGSGGKATTDFGPLTNEATGIAIQGDGQIVAVGFVQTPGRGFGLARFNSDGTLDTSFGSGGKVATDISGASDFAHSVVLQPDGKIVVGGATHFSGRIDEAHALALDADGGLVVVGESGGNFAVARYDIAGNLDATFGSNGFIGSPFPTSQGTLGSAVAVQKNGTIFAAGWAFNILGSYDFAVAAFENIPQIANAFLDGKNLLVSGRNFGTGAVILVDGTARRTISDSQNPRSLLVGKKVGKSIGAGQRVMLQVQNPSGVVSSPFPFMRPD